MKILVAEDDATSRAILASVLHKHGYEVTEAVNGKVALQLMQSASPPHLVILDWVMPEMDGMEVLKRIRAVPTDNPPYVIMLTHKESKSDIVEGLDNGANDYLIKPFDLGELRARVAVGQRMLELQDAVAAKITELQEALEHIRTLRGIVPICANCKKIRDDEGYWHRVEAYVSEHTEAQFSHGICPECAKALYPGRKLYSSPPDGMNPK